MIDGGIRMSTETVSPPEALDEHSPQWHIKKFIQFTKYKGLVGEPSPHLAMVGHMAKGKDRITTAWMIGCYAASYCLPTAQIMWSNWSHDEVLRKPKKFRSWLEKDWKGIVTRQERRCVRTPDKMFRCVHGYATWLEAKKEGFSSIIDHNNLDPHEYYDMVWDRVCSVPFIGRYIGIRLVEGLRRFCAIPAYLYDVRSMGGWSPKKALVYMYPDKQKWLLSDTPKANRIADKIAGRLLVTTQEKLPNVNYYVLAAMLCEYREYFERRHQYPAWTIDQEPLLYDKVRAYWGKDLDTKLFWSTRKALFPSKALGESNDGWYGTRWDCASTLRDYGYIWSDLKYDFKSTLKRQAFAKPVVWS